MEDSYVAEDLETQEPPLYSLPEVAQLLQHVEEKICQAIETILKTKQAPSRRSSPSSSPKRRERSPPRRRRSRSNSPRSRNNRRSRSPRRKVHIDFKNKGRGGGGRQNQQQTQQQQQQLYYQQQTQQPQYHNQQWQVPPCVQSYGSNV